jgi:hypothetical protein
MYRDDAGGLIWKPEDKTEWTGRGTTVASGRPGGEPMVVGARTEPFKFRASVDCKMIVVYAAYLPVQIPLNLGHQYSANADHLVRTNWVASNRIFSEPGQYAELKIPTVYGEGYMSEEDGTDDLAEVFGVLFPGCNVPRMILEPPLEVDSAPQSIVLREPTTKLAAITELLSLYPRVMSWGIWEGGQLVIEDPAELDAYSITDEPGVDVRGAALSDEGAVDLVEVAYIPKPLVEPESGSFIVETAKLLLVDAAGTVSYPAAGWEPAAGQRVAFVDATGTANSDLAAARIGQLVAISRQHDQWTGSVRLRAISGASLVRPGRNVAGCGISGNALITSTSCDVDGDGVSLALGSEGYEGRFLASVPGRPTTVSPAARPDAAGYRFRKRRGGPAAPPKKAK